MEDQKIRKTTLPSSWKTKKSEKRRFQVVGKPQNQKNNSSAMDESLKIRKTTRQPWMKAQKSEKQLVSRG
ncbi:hypothetical protein [Hoylesella enoeca]|uniref:hypothetical protein n=1 Tax=Hoylesella enoeca TaxID=76123 RepID=UPI000A51CEA7|nr:hypothetical protein [Hoylesella enoeca]